MSYNMFHLRPAPRTGISRQFFIVGVAVTVLIAGLFRFWDLADTAIWMDEAFTIMAGRMPVRTILFDEIDVHPPLAYLIQHYWMQIWPDLAMARVPSAVLGTATVLVVIGWVADLWSRKAALWAGLLLALSTGHIYYSQDARMYPLLLFCLALAQWGLIGSQARASESKLNGYVLLYLVAAFAAIHTHVIALIFLAVTNLGALVFLLWLRAYGRMLKQFLPMNILLLALSIPWLLQVLDTSSSFHGIGGETTPTLIAFFIRNAVGYAGLPRMLDLVVLALLAAGSISGGIMAFLSGRKVFALISLSGLILFPLTLIILNMISPILAARSFLPLLLPICCLTGIFLSMLRPPLIRWLWGGFLVAVAAWASIHEHLGRTKHDDPRAALSAARLAGYAEAPVITCHFLDAGAVSIAAEQLDVAPPELMTHHAGEVFRYDLDFFNAVKMSMAQLRRSSADELEAFLKGEHLYEDGLQQALRDYDRIALISNSCNEDWIQRTAAVLPTLGYSLDQHERFRRQGRVVMENGNTQLLLFSR